MRGLKTGGKQKGYRSPKTLAQAAGRTRALRQADITAEHTMLQLARHAFVDRTAIWREGRLLPFEEWPADNRALLEGFEVIIKNAAAGDGHTDTVHKVHLARQFPALEAIAKHFGLISDRHDVDVTLHADWLEELNRQKQLNREAKSLPAKGESAEVGAKVCGKTPETRRV